MELTMQPLSNRIAVKPRFSISIPQASPVGPAPTTATSKCSMLPLQESLDFSVNVFESAAQRLDIGAAALCHIWPSATFTADRLGHVTHKFAGLNLRCEVLAHG